eukprot:2987450-Ditylum_brightwellii.AAC.1
METQTIKVLVRESLSVLQGPARTHQIDLKIITPTILWRCGVTAYVEEASWSAKPSGCSAYGMPHAIRTTEA